MMQTQHFLTSNVFFPLHHHHHQLASTPLPFSSSPTSFYRPLPASSPSVSAHSQRPIAEPWFLQLAEEPTEEEGPVELPSSDSSIFASSDNPTSLQTSTSILLTGAITVFLFRSLRRRAKRAKELRLRSSEGKNSLKEEALERLKAIAPTPVDAKAPPSPVQALLGALAAGAIALILYNFTTTIESALNRQTLSDNYSVRPKLGTVLPVLLSS